MRKIEKLSVERQLVESLKVVKGLNRSLYILETENGNTLRVRVARDKTKYTRKKKHKNKSV